jgi:membrane-associated phospholipid phosphatase
MEPTAGLWHAVPSLNPQPYVSPPPPANDSAETLSELGLLRSITHNLTAGDRPRFDRWTSENTVLTHWSNIADQMARKYGLSAPAGARVQALLADAVNTALIATWNNKYRYLRPRPTMLDPNVAAVIPVPNHPSYPAGHPAVAGAASRILSQFFPGDAATFLGMALDVCIFRMQAGAHFPSDVRAGLDLGTRVADDILRVEAQSGAPMGYGN